MKTGTSVLKPAGLRKNRFFPVLCNSLKINLLLECIDKHMECFGYGYALQTKAFSGK